MPALTAPPAAPPAAPPDADPPTAQPKFAASTLMTSTPPALATNTSGYVPRLSPFSTSMLPKTALRERRIGWYITSTSRDVFRTSEDCLSLCLVRTFTFQQKSSNSIESKFGSVLSGRVRKPLVLIPHFGTFKKNVFWSAALKEAIANQARVS